MDDDMSSGHYAALMSSACTTSDSGSNWSQQHLLKGRYRGRKPRTRRTKQQPKPLRRKTIGCKRDLNLCRSNTDLCRPNTPDGSTGLCVQRYWVRLSAAHGRAVRSLLNEINEEAMVVQALYPLYEDATRLLEIEVMKLKQRAMELEAEAMEIKRKRWCSLCFNEATYAHQNRFFCSKHCEIKYFNQSKNN